MPKPRTLHIEPGQQFGLLTVLREIPNAGKRRKAECRCECGTVRKVDLYKLVSGHSTSCGCVRTARLAAWVNSPENAERLRSLHRDPGFRARRTELFRSPEYRARLPKPNLTHGLADHPLYGTWRGILERCENPGFRDYRHYGGRGITVCAEWHDVGTFIGWIEANLGPRPDGYSLDRWPDNDGNYEPGNVRWATPKEQAANRRPNFNLTPQTAESLARLRERTGMPKVDLINQAIQFYDALLSGVLANSEPVCPGCVNSGEWTLKLVDSSAGREALERFNKPVA